MLKAWPLLWKELEPGLPPKGFLGSVPIVGHVDDHIKTFLTNPLAAILPEMDRPKEAPRAKVQARRKEHWHEVASHLYELPTAVPTPSVISSEPMRKQC